MWMGQGGVAVTTVDDAANTQFQRKLSQPFPPSINGRQRRKAVFLDKEMDNDVDNDHSDEDDESEDEAVNESEDEFVDGGKMSRTKQTARKKTPEATVTVKPEMESEEEIGSEESVSDELSEEDSELSESDIGVNDLEGKK